ncbi:MAG: molecular chaperone TorD family protein [Acidobacteria bacterium]|nr:molecular chaperone TorD family protein [Acidobacteriota bacterium]
MTHPDTEPERRQQLRDEAVGRSVLYGFMSLALHSPTPETYAQFSSGDTPRVLREAASVIGDATAAQQLKPAVPSSDDKAIDIAARVNDWIQTFQPLTLDQLLDFQGKLFGHTARGLVCPYETEYGQEALFQQPRQLAAITGFYHAFGLAPRNSERERVDHVSCELEFLEFLSLKEAYALESGDGDMRAETCKATRLFLKDHVGRFGRAFARSLQEQDSMGFFARLGDLLYDSISLECRRLQIEAGPPLLRLRSAEEDGVPMACGQGSESDLVQLEVPG